MLLVVLKWIAHKGISRAWPAARCGVAATPLSVNTNRSIVMRQSIRRPLLSRVTFWVIVVAATFDLVSNVAFPQTPQQTESAMKSMLGAIQANSLTDFVALADQSVKSAMTQQILDNMNQLLGPRLKQGYTVVGMGALRKEGAVVYLWKLEFKDEGDDVLVTMAVKDEKIAGFYLR